MSTPVYPLLAQWPTGLLDEVASLEVTSFPVVVGLTGASATVLGLAVIRELLRAGRRVEVVPSGKSLLVLQQETGLTLKGSPEEKALALCAFVGLNDERMAAHLTFYGDHEIGAKPASGTYRTAGMVISPCSMGTLAKVAHGISDSLLTRAADVTLKEHRRLIIVPRETPLNSIQLQNMLTLAQAGACIVPPMLAYYSPEFHTLDGQVRYFTGKVLDLLNIPHTLHERWAGV